MMNRHIHPGAAVGEFIKLPGGLDCYYSKAAVTKVAPGSIIFLADIFGIKFRNSQLLCDRFARGGYDVYMPDILSGDSMDPESVKFMIEPDTGLLGSVYKGFKLLGALPSMLPFFYRHGAAVTMPFVLSAAKDIKALAKEKGNGIVSTIGFCFGGKYSIMLAGQEEQYVTSYAAAHPSFVDVAADVTPVKVPGIWVLAEGDSVFSERMERQSIEILKRGLGAQFHKYKDVKHGFVIRGGPGTESQREEAVRKFEEFFAVHLQGPTEHVS